MRLSSCVSRGCQLKAEFLLGSSSLRLILIIPQIWQPWCCVWKSEPLDKRQRGREGREMKWILHHYFKTVTGKSERVTVKNVVSILAVKYDDSKRESCFQSLLGCAFASSFIFPVMFTHYHHFITCFHSEKERKEIKIARMKKIVGPEFRKVQIIPFYRSIYGCKDRSHGLSHMTLDIVFVFV